MTLRDAARTPATLLALLAITAGGCTVIGPAALSGGRAAYNDAITATNNQQILAAIVHRRYGEPAGLLAVSSVTASMRFQATAGAQVGIGPDSNYAGNLVPLSAGVAYEEAPTISYAPVQGEKYMRQLLSPVPLDVTVLLLDAMSESGATTTLLLRSVNGIRNPGFRTDAATAPDPRFARFAELLAALTRDGRATWVSPKADGGSTALALALTGDGETYSRQVGELYGLLGFPAPDDLGGVIILPVTSGLEKPAKPALVVETRSLYDLFGIAAASVDVPEEHLESGLAERMPPAGAAAESMRIRRSKSAPKDAMTAVRIHDWWYSIENTDAASKRTFRILSSLLTVTMAEGADRRGAPVLTLPTVR